MTMRRKVLERRPQDDEIRAFLLKPWSHDYFAQLPSLGEARAREVWEAEREELLAEFAVAHPERKPLGWHFFDQEE
jgi:hypothetical protein